VVSEVSTGGDAVQQDAGLADGGRAGGGAAAGRQADGPQAGARIVTAVADAPTVDVTRLRVAIARLSRLLRKHELAGLTPTQLAALATVEQAGPLRLGDLAAAERIAPSTLTRLVSALEDHGYVQRRAVPGDARAWTLVVTATGHEVLDRIRQENTIQLADSLLTLSPDQLAALAAALPALEQLADAGPHDPAG
jgi:DNA-binding MarR family transcriptional regulator